MLYKVQEIIDKIGTKDINKIRTLLSLPEYEKHRYYMTGHGGRCFIYDLDDERFNQLAELYQKRRKIIR